MFVAHLQRQKFGFLHLTVVQRCTGTRLCQAGLASGSIGRCNSPHSHCGVRTQASVGGALDLLTFSPPGLSSLVGGKFFRPKIRIGLATTLTDQISKCLATASWGARNSSVSWRQATSSRQLGGMRLLGILAGGYVVTFSWGARNSSTTWRQATSSQQVGGQHTPRHLGDKLCIGPVGHHSILAASYVVAFSWGARNSSASWRQATSYSAGAQDIPRHLSPSFSLPINLLCGAGMQGRAISWGDTLLGTRTAIAHACASSQSVGG